MSGRFWVSLNDGHTWREVTKLEYVALERAMGFNNTMGEPEEPATAAFSRNRVRGTQVIPVAVMQEDRFKLPPQHAVGVMLEGAE